MLIAFKKYSQAPQKPEGMPGNWPCVQIGIEPREREAYLKTGHHIVTEDEFKAYLEEHQAEFDLWFENHGSPTHPNRLKVYDLVKDEFKFYHPSKIDFRRHLKPEVNLQKTVEMLKNGRPKRAEYWFNSSKICEIRFDFEVDQLNFMTRRTEMLGYVNQSNEITKHYAIHDQVYDRFDTHHARERIRERVEGRSLILDEIKSKLEIYLFQYFTELGKPYSEILDLAGNFWASYASGVSAWLNTGTTQFKEAVLADETFEFLDLIIPPELTGAPESMKIRDYIDWRLTY